MAGSLRLDPQTLAAGDGGGIDGDGRRILRDLDVLPDDELPLVSAPLEDMRIAIEHVQRLAEDVHVFDDLVHQHGDLAEIADLALADADLQREPLLDRSRAVDDLLLPFDAAVAVDEDEVVA